MQNTKEDKKTPLRQKIIKVIHFHLIARISGFLYSKS